MDDSEAPNSTARQPEATDFATDPEILAIQDQFAREYETQTGYFSPEAVAKREERDEAIDTMHEEFRTEEAEYHERERWYEEMLERAAENVVKAVETTVPIPHGSALEWVHTADLSKASYADILVGMGVEPVFAEMEAKDRPNSEVLEAAQSLERAKLAYVTRLFTTGDSQRDEKILRYRHFAAEAQSK